MAFTEADDAVFSDKARALPICFLGRPRPRLTIGDLVIGSIDILDDLP